MPESRGFLMGFEIFGVTALGNYIAKISADGSWLQEFIELAYHPSWGFLTPTESWTTPHGLLDLALLSVWALLPQLAFALFGGFLMCGFGRDERLNLDDSQEPEPDGLDARSADIS